jgi:hypothetical protein
MGYANEFEPEAAVSAPGAAGAPEPADAAAAEGRDVKETTKLKRELRRALELHEKCAADLEAALAARAELVAAIEEGKAAATERDGLKAEIEWAAAELAAERVKTQRFRQATLDLQAALGASVATAASLTQALGVWAINPG